MPPDDPGYWYPSVETVVALHYVIPRRPSRHDPDDRGLREVGAIEGAIARAHGPYFTCGGGLDERAAFLLRGICQDHAFVNANKRTAMLVTAVFLRHNGLALVVKRKELVSFMLDVAQANVTFEEMTQWIGGHCEPLPRLRWHDIARIDRFLRRRTASWQARRDLLATRRLLETLRDTRSAP